MRNYKAECAAKNNCTVLASASFNQDSFLKFWLQYCGNLHIMKPGSDYCDRCTHLRINCKLTSTMHPCLFEAFIGYAQSRCCCKYFRLHHDAVFREGAAGLRHSSRGVFDFAEKVLPPFLLHQQDQLHFGTGLKVDFFEVSVRNLQSIDIFCHPGGPCPSSKTTDEVVPMLHYSIYRAKRRTSNPVFKMQLDTDNCGGQNKNRYILKCFFGWSQ